MDFAMALSPFLRRALRGLLVVSLLCLPVVSSHAESKDPVLTGVLEMLEGEISEEIILEWLESGPRPARPGASEMVALKKAGASDKLLSQLLALAGAPEPAAPPPTPAPSQPSQTFSAPPPTPTAPSQTTPSPQPRAVESSPRTAVRPEPAQAPSPGGVPVSFELYYVPDFGEDDPEWDLFVYLDGEPLTSIPAGSPLIGGKTLSFERHLAPGRHVFRLVQERHERRGRTKWFHLARVLEETIEVDLAPGTQAFFSVRFRQGLLQGHLNPVSYRFAQGSEEKRKEGLGGDPDGWPVVCEELRSNLKANGQLPRSLRADEENCVRWADLWTSEVPSRDAVRRLLESFRYRPVAE